MGSLTSRPKTPAPQVVYKPKNPDKETLLECYRMLKNLVYAEGVSITLMKHDGKYFISKGTKVSSHVELCKALEGLHNK